MKINFTEFGQTLTDKVIIINGPSCSGKTTVAKEICKQSNDEFVILQIDEVKKYLSTTNFKIPFREIRRTICDEIMLGMAKIFLKNGKNVVIDTTFNAEDNAMKLMKSHIDDRSPSN
jgi:predicted kinase